VEFAYSGASLQTTGCVYVKNTKKEIYTRNLSYLPYFASFVIWGEGGGGGKGLFYSCVSNAITQPFEGYVSSLALTVGNKRGSRGV